MLDPLYNFILDESIIVKDRSLAIEKLVELQKGDCAWILLYVLLKKSERKGVQAAATKGLIAIKEFLPPRFQALAREILFEQELPFFPKRAIIATLLGRLHHIEAADLLFSIALDPMENRFVRSAAIEGLGELQYTPASDSLLQILQNESEDTKVRAAAAIVLGWLHDNRAVPHLITLLEHNESLIWLVAVDALVNFEQSSITEELLKLYIKFVDNAEITKIKRLQEALTSRNLLVVLETADTFRLSFLKDLIMEQENVNLQQLDFIRERTENEELKQFIANLMIEIQPKVKNSAGFEFLI
jgi:HEAT repeat protein